MKKFKECIIHIGTEKTGTTTLQTFFQKNRSNLIKNDIFITETLGKPSQWKLSAYASDIQKIDDLRKSLNLFNKKDIEKFRSEIEKTFKKEISNTNCSKLLISSEHLHSRLTTVEEIQNLKNFLDDYTNSYKIIVYIRPQHEMAISLFSTRCKVGLTNKEIFPETNENSKFYNLENLLNRWSEVFGAANIIVKIFSREEFQDGDIKKDFVKILGLNWNDFDDVKNANESLNIEAQRFLLEINKFIPKFIDGKENKIRGNIVEVVSKNREGTGMLPTPDEAESFYKIFENSNENLRQKWFPNKKELFRVDFDKYPKNTNGDSDFLFAFEIFAELWSTKQQEILDLRKKLNLK